MFNQISIGYLLLATLVMFLVTYALRGFPFLAFCRNQQPPKAVMFLGLVISPAIIAALILYCVKEPILNGDLKQGLYQLACIVLCALLHKWKGNPMLSIVPSTILYMVLVQNF